MRPGTTSDFFYAIGIIASSFIWFAFGAIVALLSQIEKNTRGQMSVE
jgi:arginine exporter protein ArgO